MIRRVLVATDGSERAQRAEAFAGQLVAPGQQTEIELIYVHPQLAPERHEPDPDRPWQLERHQLSRHVIEAGDVLLEAAEQRVRSAPAAAEAPVWKRLLCSNDVAGIIVREADRSSADLIVLGGRAHGAIALLGGGVCSEVLRRTHRPVLLVP